PSVWTRRVDLKLLVLFGLVCLPLMVASVAGALILSYLHLNVSDVLNENVRSTYVATRLEATTKDLIRLLRSDSTDSGRVNHIGEQTRRAYRMLRHAEDLANLENERDLVSQIAAGLERYSRARDQREAVASSSLRRFDGELADNLEREVLR